MLLSILESDASLLIKLRYAFTLFLVFGIGIAMNGFFYGPAVQVEWVPLVGIIVTSFLGLAVLDWRFPGNGKSVIAVAGGFIDGMLFSILVFIAILSFYLLMAISLLLIKVGGLFFSIF